MLNKNEDVNESGSESLETTIKKIFYYNSLDADTKSFLLESEEEIDFIVKQSGWKIGHILLKVKDRLPHGDFGTWLDNRWGWTDRTAQSMMNIARSFKSEIISDLFPRQVQNLLASTSTPESAMEEAISRAEDGEKPTHAQVKELVEAKKAIAGLENKIASLESQLPTEVVLLQIEKLKADLETALTKPAKLIIEQEQALVETNEVNRRLQDQIETLEQTLSAAATKPPEMKIVEKVVEKIPGDYESLKEQRDALNVEIVTLQKKIKSNTKTHNDEVDFKVNAKVKELRGTIAEREHHLAQVKGEIAKLYIVRSQLDSDVGDIAASQETCKIVRQRLLEIALALHNLLDDHIIHPDCEADIEHLCRSMEDGAADFRRYLNQRPGGKTVEILKDGYAIGIVR